MDVRLCFRVSFLGANARLSELVDALALTKLSLGALRLVARLRKLVTPEVMDVFGGCGDGDDVLGI